MEIYIVTYAHQYDGEIYQEVRTYKNREDADKAFDSYVEDCYDNTVGPSVMGGEYSLEEYKANNTKKGWVFDYETGDCTEQYHVEVFVEEV